MPRLTRYCLFLMVALACSATAQPRPMQEGTHYFAVTPPVATRANDDIIEILDVFWYGCAQCLEFEPMMTYYGNQIRGDLVMRRMPAIRNETMRTHARVYYTAVELGIEQQAHPAAFSYVQEQQLPLNTVEQAQQFFASLGVKAEDFDKAWHSGRVEEELAAAQADTTSAGIERVPALLVNGNYRVERNAAVPELTEVIITANQLIRVERDKRRPD